MAAHQESSRRRAPNFRLEFPGDDEFRREIQEKIQKVKENWTQTKPASNSTVLQTILDYWIKNNISEAHSDGNHNDDYENTTIMEEKMDRESLKKDIWNLVDKINHLSDQCILLHYNSETCEVIPYYTSVGVKNLQIYPKFYVNFSKLCHDHEALKTSDSQSETSISQEDKSEPVGTEEREGSLDLNNKTSPVSHSAIGSQDGGTFFVWSDQPIPQWSSENGVQSDKTGSAPLRNNSEPLTKENVPLSVQLSDIKVEKDAENSGSKSCSHVKELDTGEKEYGCMSTKEAITDVSNKDSDENRIGATCGGIKIEKDETIDNGSFGSKILSENEIKVEIDEEAESGGYGSVALNDGTRNEVGPIRMTKRAHGLCDRDNSEEIIGEIHGQSGKKRKYIEPDDNCRRESGQGNRGGEVIGAQIISTAAGSCSGLQALPHQTSPKRLTEEDCADPIVVPQVGEKFDFELADEGDDSTQKRLNQLAVGLFQRYLQKRSCATNFEEFGVRELDKWLSEFYADFRKRDGTHYTADYLSKIRNGLNRYLKSHPFDTCFDIIKDHEFRNSNLKYQAVRKELKKLCCKRSIIANTASDALSVAGTVIADEDIKKLYSSRHLSTSTPQGLYNKVHFDIRFYFCRDWRELTYMTKSTFTVKRDQVSGLQFVTRTEDHRTWIEGLDDQKASEKMIESPGSPLCPVASYVKYVGKLNPRCDKLWQHVKTTFIESLEKEKTWYCNQQVGKKTMQSFMSDLSAVCNLSKSFTNHSIRTTGLKVISGDHQSCTKDSVFYVKRLQIQ